MKYSIARREHSEEGGKKFRFWLPKSGDIPSLDDALDAVCAIGPGRYQINSSDGHVNLLLRISRDGVKTVIHKRGLHKPGYDAEAAPPTGGHECPPPPRLINRLPPPPLSN